MIIITSLTLFLLTFLPGLYFLRNVRFIASDTNKKRMLSAINDTTDGVFLGLGLFHMMPEMIETASHLGFHFSFALLACFAIIVSFVILSVIYQKFSEFFKPDRINESPDAQARYSSLGLLLSAILILSFHSVSEGVALGFK